MQAILYTAEFRRVEALPRRDWQEDTTPELIADITAALKTKSGTMTLRPVQAAMIKEAYENCGLIAPVGVGHGKTLPSLLIFTVLNSQRPLLLVPAPLKKRTVERDIPELSRHWKIKQNIVVESYDFLSGIQNQKWLWSYKPDVIIADEGHNLKTRKAARTKRFLKYFKEHPQTIFCVMSGTITKNSLLDFSHLAALALRERSPLPRSYNDLTAWDYVISTKRDDHYHPTTHPGALARIEEYPGQSPREIFQRRFSQTPGVVCTTDTAVPNSIVIHPIREVPMPPAVATALQRLDKAWELPDGIQVWDHLEQSRYGMELSAGFFNRWIEPPPEDWMDFRKAYISASTEIRSRGFKDIDSQGTLEQAIEDGRIHCPPYWPWKNIRKTYTPKTAENWVDQYLVREAIRRSRFRPSIIWYYNPCVGEAFRKLGIETYGSSNKDKRKLDSLIDGMNAGKLTIACSWKTHGFGKRMQAWSHNIVVQPPASGLDWQQLIGRTHREGQQADEVTIEVMQHTKFYRKAFEKALLEARYLQETGKEPQKLLLATVAY